MTSTARGTAALLRDRTFGPFFFGNLTSNIGIWFQNVAAAVVVFQLTRSAVMVGAVSVMQFAPAMVLAPWAGALTDRVDRRGLLLVGQSISAVSAGVLAGWTLLVGMDGLPGPWPILVATMGVGLGNALSIPSMQALIPALVPTRDLDQAIALNSVTFNLARAVGPALGAFTLVALGAGAAFGVNALTYLALITALLMIRPRPVEREASADRSVRGGLRYVRRNRTVAVLLLGVGALGIGSDPIYTLTPSIADGLVAAGRTVLVTRPDALVGLLVSAFGLGAVAATLLVRWTRERFGLLEVGVAGLVLLGVGMEGLALSTHELAALVSLTASGFGFLLAIACLTTLLHIEVPEELRGRVMALWGVAFLGSRPVAALLDGGIADLTSPSVAAAVAGLLTGGIALIVWRTLREGASK